MLGVVYIKNPRQNNSDSTFSFTNLILLFIVGILFYFASNITDGQNKTININYTEFVERLNNDEIESIYIEEGSSQIEAYSKDGVTIITDNPNTEQSNNTLYNSGVSIKKGKSFASKLITIFDYIWIGLIILLVIGMFSKSKKGGLMGKSLFEDGIDTENKKTNVKFNDIAGNEESKEAMSELVYFLKHPDKYKKYGIKAPKGAMLFGPPGTGKTLLAKAVAGESNANFIAVTGSDFVDKFVGNGASRVRHLFEEARKMQPCIIFIDEIDAVGGKRGVMSSNEERNQTLNALLAEIDGFSQNDSIIVLGATNRLDSLDDALLRSGRFDTKIYVGLPDLKARKEIFMVHSHGKPVSYAVDFEKLAKMTTGFSGADIENVMNKAGFYAAKLDKESIDMDDINKGINHLIAGEEKKDRSGISEDDKKLTAYHEAGHALMAKLYAKVGVPKITIIPTTHGAGGYTLIDNNEKAYRSKKDILNQIAISLGGRAAEEIIFGKDNVTTGASGDIKKVTELAVNMITTYGMSSEYGLLAVQNQNGISKEVLSAAKEIVDEIYLETLKFLRKNIDTLHSLSNMLLDLETVNEDDFDAIVNNHTQLDIFDYISDSI